jgi:predicted RNA-binding Zn ribbon-like protein
MDERAFSEQAEGKPAPMPLLAVQAFANTLDIEEGTDRLEDPASFQAWLEEGKMVTPGFELERGDLDAVRRLRDALRDSLTANTSGKLDPAAADRLAKLAGTWRIELDCDGQGRFALDLTPARDLAELGAQFLGIVFQAQLEGSWPRLKLCDTPECCWAFYDSSRNRSGSWCRMGECGNRLKNRAYRARQSTRRSRR